MQPTATGDYVRDFVDEVLRTGSVLLELVDDLIESMPEEAFAGFFCTCIISCSIATACSYRGWRRSRLGCIGNSMCRSSLPLE